MLCEHARIFEFCFTHKTFPSKSFSLRFLLNGFSVSLLGCNLSYIVDLFAALHNVASASARTLLKLESSVRALLKPYGHTLRTFVLIVFAHPYCARKFACHVMHRARTLSTKRTMIGQMAIAIALIGFNDLGRSMTLTFLVVNRFHLQLSPLCPKTNKKSMWEVEKKFKMTVHGTWNPAILRLQGP